MISSAFKSAYQNEFNQQSQMLNTINTGIKDLGTAMVGMLGFNGTLGSGTMAKAAKLGLANKIGGIGGALMVATMDEKTKPQGTPVTQENVLGALGDNPINNTARKQLTTVFEQLNLAKEQNLMTKEGKIASPMGDVDPNSNLGKQILSQLNKPKTMGIEEKNPSLTVSAEELEKKYGNKEYFNEGIEETVKKRVGTTYDWRETGYITSDGTRIDLSGKNQGARPGGRTVDHRDIFEIEDITGEYDRDKAMVEFMKRGNIRVNPEYPGVNIQKEPTKEQYSSIQNMAERLGWKQGYFAVDIDNEKGQTIGSLTYESPISGSKIVSDIQEYYKTGKLPKEEEV